ncbi:hypothetical protein J437_LFUL013451 [Ladona fulva]|uniref:Uncharacterized protein n=1 Tax=Ladona fulva TaxID=123851 RepID=A0A8K0KJU4_LADFU|nr:hypothetical protein J437_LFUL013451 [Ladona fulva]
MNHQVPSQSITSKRKNQRKFLKRKCSEVSSTAASAENPPLPKPEDIQAELRSEAAPQEKKRRKKKSDLLTLQQM